MKIMEQPTLDQNENKDYQYSNPNWHSPINYLGNELAMPFIHNNLFLFTYFCFLFFQRIFFFSLLFSFFSLLSLIGNKNFEKAFIICQLISRHIHI